MSEVIIKPGESFEVALKKFNRVVQNAGILSEVRRHRYYETPNDRRKRKAAVAQRRKQQHRSR